MLSPVQGATLASLIGAAEAACTALKEDEDTDISESMLMMTEISQALQVLESMEASW
jgi:hypothetical protein